MTITQEAGKAKPRVLFVLKLREVQDPDGGYSHGGLSSGLLNSARFVSDMLEQNGILSKVVQVIDNNSIDRELTNFKPDVCVIEAVWVVPEKFDVLTKLHPSVKFIVRLHSNSPFASLEGMFYDWVMRYLDYGPQMHLNANGHEMFSSLQMLLENKYRDQPDLLGNSVDVSEHLSYLPNYYPVNDCKPHQPHHERFHLDVGCFGAIRPLKDQVIQAIAAMRFADELGKPLRFHINATRSETNGGPVLKNLRSLFAAQKRHELVEHPWVERTDFMKVAQTMDIGLQVSFSETFNIVSADLVNLNIPIVVSKEVSWVDHRFQADTTDVADIVDKMRLAYGFDRTDLAKLNKGRLERYSNISRELWLGFVRSLV